jgi:TonB family protein
MKVFTIASIVAAFALSMAVNAGLFSLLPILGYWHKHRTEKVEDGARETNLVPLPTLPKKKEKPKPTETKTKSAAKPNNDLGKNLARQRFVMDLGMGGGLAGVSVGGNAMEKSNLEQVAYSEGETDEDVQPISQMAPKRPKEAEKAGITGRVRALLTVGEEGNVVDIDFLEVPGNYGFEEAVREAVSKWRYKPAMMGGIPVRQRIEQPFQF